MALRARQLGGGRPGHHRFRVFSEWREITAWICDHLLSAPEAGAWAWGLPELRPLLRDEDARRALAAEAWASEGAAVDSLYRSLCALLGPTVTEGYRRGWWWIEDETSFYYTPLGALLALEDGKVSAIAMTGVGGRWIAEAGDPAERASDPLPWDAGLQSLPGDDDEARFAAFLGGAREAQALFHAAVLRSKEAINSPRFFHRLRISDPEACRALVLAGGAEA